MSLLLFRLLRSLQVLQVPLNPFPARWLQLLLCRHPWH
jgi:hypothetical protein